jgi:hypothetical protein
MGVEQVNETSWVDDYNQLIVNVHRPNQCRNDYCTIHNPSRHPMSDFPQRWRQDKKVMERMCPHGIGHPDPDDIALDKVHACDGCCGGDFK